MRVICVDDERLLMEDTVALCRKLDLVEDAEGFTKLEGRPVVFRQAKCKELLAYLIDRHGAGVTRREAFAILWEDRSYDRPMQKQLDTIIRMLRTSLAEHQAESIFELQSATMRVNPDLISCDAWNYLDGDPEAIRAFRGEYMNNYSWASLNEGVLAGHALDKA